MESIMNWPTALRVGHVLAALAAILLIGFLGRALARALRQPTVIGEVAVGVLAGPAVVAVAGSEGLNTVLPTQVLSALRELGHAGLALFLVGVARELRIGTAEFRGRAALPSVARVAAGSLLLPLTFGAALAGWVLWTGDPLLRGTAPAPALVLLLAVAISVTAVPVLARILVDRGMTRTDAGVLSLVSAAIIDAVAWVLLAVAIGLAAGTGTGAVRAIAVLAIGIAVAWLAQRLLRTGPVSRLCARWSVPVGVLVGVATLAAAGAAEHWGLTAVFGALLVGLALPVDDGPAPWSSVVAGIAKIGRWLVPVFFVVTGITLLTGIRGAPPWLAMVLVVLLAIAGKTVGSYLGARLGGQSRRTGLQIAALMNTRGLTEIVVLQAGYSAGILTPALYLAYVVMALVTTGLTGPLLSVIAHLTPRAAATPSSR